MQDYPFIGIIRVTGKGVGYFPNPEDEENDFEIAPENINTALNGDNVRIEPTGKTLYSRKQAKVVEIIERKKTRFVGTLDDGFVVPDDKRMYRDIHVGEETLGAKNGDKVQAEIVEWTDASKSPKGKVVRIIGRKGEHNAEMQGIVYEAGFEIDFPPRG